MLDTNNTPPMNENDPMLAIPHDELRIEYGLLREQFDVMSDLYNCAVKRWLHQGDLFALAVRRAEKAEQALLLVNGHYDLACEDRRKAEREVERLRAITGEPKP